MSSPEGSKRVSPLPEGAARELPQLCLSASPLRGEADKKTVAGGSVHGVTVTSTSTPASATLRFCESIHLHFEKKLKSDLLQYVSQAHKPVPMGRAHKGPSEEPIEGPSEGLVRAQLKGPPSVQVKSPLRAQVKGLLGPN